MAQQPLADIHIYRWVSFIGLLKWHDILILNIHILIIGRDMLQDMIYLHRNIQNIEIQVRKYASL